MNSPPCASSRQSSCSKVSTNPFTHPSTNCPATRNPDFATQLSPDYLNDPAHCPADRPSHARSLFGLRAMDDDGGLHNDTSVVSHEYGDCHTLMVMASYTCSMCM